MAGEAGGPHRHSGSTRGTGWAEELQCASATWRALRTGMRRLARSAVAGAQQALAPAGLATKSGGGSSVPQTAAVVHPPVQSLRPAALPGDKTHTEKWLQVRVVVWTARLLGTTR